MVVGIENIKDRLERLEEETLSKYAVKSKNTKGRKYKCSPCPVRTEFQRDRDRILHSKAFRRLKHKTQVFFAPNNDHYRTRMTHTLEVTQVARTMARALRLNEDLTEAIALGHDLGHTPFGHSGESVLNKLMTNGFRHNEQSARVAEHLENLNLCRETLSGILTHSWGLKPETLEAQVVQIADKVAYINHDIDDAIRAGIITENDIPKESLEYFKDERLEKMIYDVIVNSLDKDKVEMSKECFEQMNILRDWMFRTVYVNSLAKAEEDKAKNVVEQLFEHYMDILRISTNSTDEKMLQQTACDYISGMTDQYAVEKYSQIFIPRPIASINTDDYIFELAKQNGLF